MTPDDALIWAAGFFDGEGCISSHVRPRSRGRRNWVVTLYVGQIDPRPLWMLRGLFGGEVGPRKSGRGGRQMYMWRISDGKAGRVLERLLPFLVVKHEQARLAIELRTLVEGRTDKGKLTEAEEEQRFLLLEAIHADKWKEVMPDA